jgi:lysyl-tRNA synthetase class 2
MIDALIEERRKKLEAFRAAGIDPYPAAVPRTHEAAAVFDAFKKLIRSKRAVTIAGRIMGFRKQGGVFFLDVQDGTGRIQFVVKRDDLRTFALFRDNLDIGDFVSGAGRLLLTRRGEKSVAVRKLVLLAKSLRPLPSEWHGFGDHEERYRRRYLDILMNPGIRELFSQKQRFWHAFRSFLADAGFLEVETSVLEHMPGGADAEPFTTHHNTLDHDFYLRISLELPLKRLMVAGYEKVFELGRVFRNEGIDAEHLQDYTALEYYWAYQDYTRGMAFVEKLYKHVVRQTTGKLVTTRGNTKLQWGKKWARVDYFSFFKKETGIDLKTATDAELRSYAKRQGLDPDTHPGRGRVIDLIFKKIRLKLVQPCFLIDPPIDIEPLAKRVAPGAARVARFQVVAAGTELGKGFSELNDPADQRVRFEEQMALREAGDPEAQRLDEEYLEAMEYGMPPNTGFGASERFFAVLMDKPVRETVIFPLMKPRKQP